MPHAAPYIHPKAPEKRNIFAIARDCRKGLNTALLRRERPACLRLRKGRRPTADPTPLSPIERITEILERLFLARPEVTT